MVYLFMGGGGIIGGFGGNYVFLWLYVFEMLIVEVILM